jgi:DNA polymerase-3 subunit gamma/tau
MQGGQATALALAPDTLQTYVTFQHVVDLIRERRDMTLLVEVETNLRLAKYSPGRIEFEPTQKAPRDLAARLSARLQGWTGARWAVTVVNTGGGATLAEEQDKDRLAAEAKAMENPLVQAVIAAFGKVKITVRDVATEAAFEALPEVEDEWDPFEEG